MWIQGFTAFDETFSTRAKDFHPGCSATENIKYATQILKGMGCEKNVLFWHK